MISFIRQTVKWEGQTQLLRQPNLISCAVGPSLARD